MKKTIRPVKISFGALSNLIANQLEQQGLVFEKEELRHIQQDADALIRLRIRGLLSLSVTRSAEKKIFRKIIAHVGLKNNLTAGKNIYK